MEPTEQLAIIIPALTEIVDRLDRAQLGKPTACSGFTVRGVLDHMMGGAGAFAPAFRGEQPQQGIAPGSSASLHPADHVLAVEFRRAMTGLLDAVNSPGALERSIDAPFGQVPGSVFARFIAFDGLIHGWDLATATGQNYAPPGDVVAAVDAFARETLSPDMRDGDTFALATEVPADASPLESLVAFSGRSL